MGTIEAIAFLLGIANVTLVVKRSVWNYPFGIAMVSLYAIVFHDARLYSDALLQLFFIVVNLYGWIVWSRQRAMTGTILVARLAPGARIGWAAATAAAAMGWGALMHRYTDASYPWWDAAIAAASIAAQLLLARRRIENWVVWIGVDVASILLYAAKGLWLTMVLYVIFLVLACWGLMDWRAVERRQVAGGAPA